jgi:PAS domain S-box-containing protein
MKGKARLPARLRNPSIVAPHRLRSLLEEVETYRGQLTTERRKLDEARAQLRESYSKYDELYELAPVGFLTLDRHGRIRELNEKAARLIAFPSGWLLDKPFVVFVAKPDIRRFLAHLARSIRTPEQQTIELGLAAGEHLLPVQIAIKTSEQEGAVIHRMTVVDLTDIKKTEKQLQESLDNWHSLVHNAPDVIMTLDREGKITFVNRPVWGYSAQALIGTRITDYVPRNEQVKLSRCIENVFSSGKRMTCEISGVNGDRQAWFGLSFGPIHNGVDRAAGERKTTTLMIQEISEHKLAEETLRTSGEQLREFAARVEAVREEERTRVAREIHDELGQALTVLKLDLSWLQGKIPRTQAQARNKMKSMLLHVDETIERVRRIASELRPSILDDLGLLPAIEWQLEEFQKRTGIRCKLDANVEKVGFSAEASAVLFRVVQEALTNIVRHAAASSARVDLRSDGRNLRMSITDDGKGITEQQINDLRSLGIVGMKERISRVGGEFRIRSQRGKGTRIEISLPNNHD